MKVTLIQHTPEPEKLIAAAAKLCYSDSSCENIMDGLDEEKRIILSKNKWRAIDICGIKSRADVDQLILELFK